MQELYKLMIRTTDEGVLRKCMRVYIQMSGSGCPLSTVLSQNELQQFNEEKKPLLSARGEKIMAKFTAAIGKPNLSKKQLQTNEDALNWEDINAIRKATKGCLTIMKDRINKQFDKNKDFDMSFGIAKDTPTNSSLPSNKLEQFKKEFDKNTNLFVKKREETLAQIKRSEVVINRKSKTPLRMSNISQKPVEELIQSR